MACPYLSSSLLHSRTWLKLGILAVAGFTVWRIGRAFSPERLQVSTAQEAVKPLVHCGQGATGLHLDPTGGMDWTSLIKAAIHDPRIATETSENILAAEPQLADDLTIVTAYINIGSFQKGESQTHFTPALYRRWMKIFARIQNPVVAFFSEQSDAEYFRHIRASFPPDRTRIHYIDKKTLWAFNSLELRTSQIFSNPAYPKHHPNTVVPAYSCAMHSKYEFMLRSVTENHFRTKYFAWLDIGLFRDIVEGSEPMSLYIPAGLDPDKVAYGRVAPRVRRIPLSSIFHDNLFWVCGCFFVARASVMARWAIEYMKYTDYYLCQDVMNTDQQIIYAMFNLGTPAVSLQDFRARQGYNPWFSLGYACKDEGRKRVEAARAGAAGG